MRPSLRTLFIAAIIGSAPVLQALAEDGDRHDRRPDAAPFWTEVGRSVDFDELLHHRADRPSLFLYHANPRIAVIDLPTLREQAQMFNRLAVFIEQRGAPRDRVLDDRALAAFLRDRGIAYDGLYLGHDYRLADIVRFFRLAAANRVALNREEHALAAVLRHIGAISGFGGALHATDAIAVVLSIARSGDPDTEPEMDTRIQSALLRHELSHGEYFANPAYRAYSHHFWRTEMTAAERATFLSFLSLLNYDTAAPDLIVNEMQAYLGHTDDPRLFGPESLGMSPAAFAAFRQRFRRGVAATGVRGVLINEFRNGFRTIEVGTSRSPMPKLSR